MQLLFVASASTPKTKHLEVSVELRLPMGSEQCCDFWDAIRLQKLSILCALLTIRWLLLFGRLPSRSKNTNLPSYASFTNASVLLVEATAQGRQQRPRWLVSGPPCSSSLFFQADFLAGCQRALGCHKTTKQFLKKKKGVGRLTS